jgi:4-amino-4-deoxy-L-arabinose transferase-like glycosyltransferase
LDRDAAYNGTVALDWIHHGVLPFWISNNSAPDPVMIDLQALSLAVLGVSVFALRLPGAMAGILTLAVTYRLTADLLTDCPYARLGGLVVTGAMAFSEVMVHFHRLGLRSILLPLVMGLFLIAFWRAWQRSSLPYFVLAGALLGVMLYVYPAARFAPFIVLALVIHQTIFAREGVSPRIRGLTILGVTFLIVFGPQLAFFVRYPATFARRAAETSLLANPLYERSWGCGALWESSC